MRTGVNVCKVSERERMFEVTSLLHILNRSSRQLQINMDLVHPLLNGCRLLRGKDMTLQLAFMILIRFLFSSKTPCIFPTYYHLKQKS